MPDANTKNQIMKVLHTSIMEADEDKAQATLLLLKKYEEDYIEEEVEMLESVEDTEDLPPAVREVVKDPDVADLVKQYQQSDEKFTVEKSLVDLDDIIEKPELEITDKQSKVDDLKDISAKLIATESAQSLSIVKEVGEKIQELETDIKVEQEIKTTKKKTKRTKRRRSY